MTESNESNQNKLTKKRVRARSATSQATQSQMLINYVPGEECRVAIVEDGKLEELHTERFSSASNVGNIYVGKVVNVEPAIQAAFVDFGMGENGFLHVTDLHPRYFPGEDEETTTERVGIKTPRRERPPIQAALRRGDEIIVQVLKEGVGTKGPTLTSYLSIPGRFLVMMPFMDKVGVSRKVEDEDERRKMREILDQLDLPEGFGFILRTAGMDRNKTDLKRDLSYLQRLWKDMDRRLRAGGKPRLLYSESDLLVRALRDILNNDIQEVIVDDETALRRAARFLKIVAPRTSTRLFHYQDKAPLFHAFGIEQQITLIHAREVPLPSGGRLVIDQTEALVAIDVNSGKSRDSRNSEENAYQTNIEAVDEICRQLRLRDMGGIVINDLIDMREPRHRKDIENRFRERLKRDRAKTTVLSISEFGILELTRQRMRPSHESLHFTDCPMCRGRGLLQRPDSVAADALRELGAVLDMERVHKIEMVVAPRIAGDLLSSKRRLLSRIERLYGKHVDVRVSESVPVDRVSIYAYAEDGSDIDLANRPKPRKPANLVELRHNDESAGEALMDEVDDGPLADEIDDAPVEPDADPHPIELDLPEDGQDSTEGFAPLPDAHPGEGGKRKRRRRRGRGGKGTDNPTDAHSRPPQQTQRGDEHRQGPRDDDRQSRGARRPVPRDVDEWGEPPTRLDVEAGADHAPEPLQSIAQSTPAQGEQTDATAVGEAGDGPRRRRRRRRRRRGRGAAQGDGAQSPPQQGYDSGHASLGHQHAIVGDASYAEQGEASNDDREDDADQRTAQESSQQTDQPGDGGGRKRRRRRRRRGRGGRVGQPGDQHDARDNGTTMEVKPPAVTPTSPPAEPRASTPPPPKPRTLYSNVRRRVPPGQARRGPGDE